MHIHCPQKDTIGKIKNGLLANKSTAYTAYTAITVRLKQEYSALGTCTEHRAIADGNSRSKIISDMKIEGQFQKSASDSR